MRITILLIVGIAAGCLFAIPLTSSAQLTSAPCGVVDGFDFPVPDIDIHRNDFGIFRASFGGLHVGMDVAFEQLGMPVVAAARGKVTYSDTAGWDTEKGVVVIQHTLPDGSVVNTLYGHMEELNGYVFPMMGQCVERGDIVGAIGFPSLGRPHLHYEIRTRYRHEGGPGYTQTNPLELGWLHPVDFTFLARVMTLPAYRTHILLAESPTLPPTMLPNSTYVVAHSQQVIGHSATGVELWRFDILASVINLIALNDNRVLLTTFANDVLVLDRGLFSAQWAAPVSTLAPVRLPDDRIVFATSTPTLRAFTPDGTLVWETAPFPAPITQLAVSGAVIALATADQQVWSLNAEGVVLRQDPVSAVPRLFPATENSFTLLIGSALYRLEVGHSLRLIVETERTIMASATVLDAGHSLYLYSGEGRSLYAYNADGSLRAIGYMPGSHARSPLLCMGGGPQLYALTTDGQLLAFAAEDLRLLTQVALYNGGADGSSAARWLRCETDDIVQFSSGYLSVVTLDGLALAANQ